MKRALTLKRESLAELAELAESDLGGVVGGQYTVYGLSCPIGVCVRTLPLNHCVFVTIESC